MKQLLLHPSARQQLERLVEHWPHALTIHGPHAIGKRTAVVNAVAERHNEHKQQILNDNWSQLLTITPKKDRQTIGVEQIRELNQFLTLSDDQTRYIIIDEAERLTIPAQNAFLKNLEQPQSNVRIVLVTANTDQLLPTIRSRTQLLRIQPPSLDELSSWAQEQFSDDFDPALLHVAEGSPGQLAQLLADEQKSQQISQEVSTAKQILSSSIVERLAMISNLKSNRENSKRIINHLKVMTTSAMRRVDQPGAISQWAGKADHAQQALAALDRNANTRLVWLRLMLNL